MAALFAREEAGGAATRRGASPSIAPALWLRAALALGCWTQLASCGSIEDVLVMEVALPSELTVKAGTDARLPCTFTSSEEISPATSVAWSFQREESTARPMTFFYYSDGKDYTGKSTQFNGRTRWDGNFTMRDASIIVENIQAKDNGTYFCDVKNPPDIVGEPTQVKVNILEQESRTGFERITSATPERVTVTVTTTTTTKTKTKTKTTHSGSASLNGTSFWPLLLPFFCILASFPSYLF